jgi:hypothetical protein
MCMVRWVPVLVLAFAAGTAQAQIALPAPGLSRLPGVGSPGGGIALPDRLGSAVSGFGDSPDVRRLEALRRRRVADLIRRHPRLIDRGPRGAAIIHSEVLALSPSDPALDRARAAGFSIAREHSLGALGVRIVVLRAPDGTTTERALQELRQLDPAGTYDFNHLYSESGGDSVKIGGSPGFGSAAGGRGSDSTARRVGLIDGGVEARHPVFRDVPIHLHGCGGTAVPTEYGTEVASLLVGRTARFHGAAPGAELFAADVYCGLPTGGAADAVADAFDWLAHEGVPVINVSLVGPDNALLASIVHRLIARGHIVVAAVGNDGPAAPPLYPAAYPGVIGVTAVDARGRALLEAERGTQVRFAAPGADMAAAQPLRSYAVVRGTSFAAPIVAGLLASMLSRPDPRAAARAIADLEHRAADLGAPGDDPVYGYGLVGADLRQQTALARAQ